jgi:hypothetical protein
LKIIPFSEIFRKTLESRPKKLYDDSVTLLVRVVALEVRVTNPKRQTHREMGAQSYGSAFKTDIQTTSLHMPDRQTAEGFFDSFCLDEGGVKQ